MLCRDIAGVEYSSSSFIQGYITQGVSYLWSATVWKQVILLKYPQKVNNSLMLCHHTRVTHLALSCRHFLISHRHKKGEYNTIKYFERE